MMETVRSVAWHYGDEARGAALETLAFVRHMLTYCQNFSPPKKYARPVAALV